MIRDHHHRVTSRVVHSILPLLLCLFLLFGTGMFPVHADGNVNVSIQVSPAEMRVGDNGILKINISSDTDFWGVYLNVQYDSAYLNYYCSEATGSAGSLIIKENLSTPQKSISYEIGLEALLEGSVTINVSAVVYADGIGTVLDSLYDACAITISAEGQRSDNTELANLYLSYGSLEPEFSPSVHEYTAVVPNEISSVTITTLPGEEHQMITIAGESTLAEGDNTRTINVQAQDGTLATYIVTIHRNTLAEESVVEDSKAEAEDPLTTIKVDGITRYLISVPEDIAVPDGFSLEQVSYKGYDCIGAVSGERALLYLVDYKGENGDFYWYNVEEQSCHSFIMKTINGESFLILNADKDADVPTQYTRMQIRLDDQTLQAFATNGTDAQTEIILLAVGEDGEKAYYVYDTLNEKVHLYRGTFGPSTETDEESEESLDADSLADDSAEDSLTPGDIVVDYTHGGLADALKEALPFILLGLFLLLLIVIILVVLAVNKHNRKHNILSQEQDSFDEDIVMTPSVTVTEDDSFAPKKNDNWKHITQQVPLAKMSDVHTTTLAAIYEADEISYEMMHRTQRVPDRQTLRSQADNKGTAAPTSQKAADGSAEEAYDALSPNDFFDK